MKNEEHSFVWDWDAYALCRWFTRGWTLQEMMAPSFLMFYNSSWKPIGTLVELSERVAQVTGVHEEALRRHWPVSSYSIAQRMSWASGRQLAWHFRHKSSHYIWRRRQVLREAARLQEEIMRTHSDQTLFAWLAFRTEPGEYEEGGDTTEKGQLDLLADTPDAFEKCGQVVPLVPEDHKSSPAYQVTDTGLFAEQSAVEYGDFGATIKK
ncbi:Vegetative incompatibility protein HET-E-1 [Pseudocercospora fuligena]|uniref:Vegetative incompatibility protein HET-E-1 n=1 Tax=Pseudocercospora fuligena TaxID=685502 RepID=A0A8H6RAX2_9PEZI|nr:Vegetative incompatibility protein HET-E-1 [Pseudocercospora fuligena]